MLEETGNQTKIYVFSLFPYLHLFQLFSLSISFWVEERSKKEEQLEAAAVETTRSRNKQANANQNKNRGMERE